MTRKQTDKTVQRYNQMAEEYETRWADYLDHTHRRFLEKIKIWHDDTMLDLSCGTGLLAKHIIEQGDSYQKFILNDVADNMQALAKSRFNHQPDISFTSFSAEAINQPNNSFDKIFCLNAFHNYHKQVQVLKECYRVLKPGGKLYILDWNSSGLFRLKNGLIKMMVPERIDTKSAREIRDMLSEQCFKLTSIDAWYHGSWKFYYVIGEKK